MNSLILAWALVSEKDGPVASSCTSTSSSMSSQGHSATLASVTWAKTEGCSSVVSIELSVSILLEVIYSCDSSCCSLTSLAERLTELFRLRMPLTVV